jgi:glycine cleavage system H lipoate-binding protein
MKASRTIKKQKARIFNLGENQCIWMKAGVVNFKLCDNAYDCLNCQFDKAMSRSAERKPEEKTGWPDVMKNRALKEKECRHMLTGRVQYHYCSNGYRCNVCEFDQSLDEADLAAGGGAVPVHNVAGFNVADSYYYHRGHTWARIEHGGFVRVGIDDFALRLLGCPSQIRLPKLGSHLDQTEVGWSIEKEGKQAAILSPMNGVVVATNHKVVNETSLTRKDPYGTGWLAVMEPQGLKKNLKNLLFEKEADAWLKAEAQKLESMVAAVHGTPLAATGGEIVDDIAGNLPQLKWEELVHEFLLT